MEASNSESVEFDITGVKPDEKTSVVAQEPVSEASVAQEDAQGSPPVSEAETPEHEPALIGHFVDVIEGEHKGQRAAFVKAELLDKDDKPVRVLLRFRDHNYDHEFAVVPYESIALTQYKGGR